MAEQLKRIGTPITRYGLVISSSSSPRLDASPIPYSEPICVASDRISDQRW
jgi:hypothetical protein